MSPALSWLLSSLFCSLEFLTPLAPQHFLLMASLANVGKSIGALSACALRLVGQRPALMCAVMLGCPVTLTADPPLVLQASPPSLPRSPPSTAPSACEKTWRTFPPRRRYVAGCKGWEECGGGDGMHGKRTKELRRRPFHCAAGQFHACILPVSPAQCWVTSSGTWRHTDSSLCRMPVLTAGAADGDGQLGAGRGRGTQLPVPAHGWVPWGLHALTSRTTPP